ncbi:MAG: glycoside hydrolase [Gammaproteobacteria bacterium]|nr:MAG: glycoside hydrolase [Gammaproteobacteria bacterium]
MKGSESKINVVLYWHMHQPDYRDPDDGHYHLPWTYLHTIKDYVDMVALLEENPKAKAVVNFVPTLLEQIDDYAHQVFDFINSGTPIRDNLLAGLAEAKLPEDGAGRLALARACLRANEMRMIDPFEDYRELSKLVRQLEGAPHQFIYLNDQFLIDLLVWYHIVWLGATVRRGNAKIDRLVKKGHDFDAEDRRELVTMIHDLIWHVIDRYKKLSETGQIELSMTPYAHPIMPLLLDINSARDAVPDMELPKSKTYAGGEERARWHIEEGFKSFEKFFGIKPKGCWPAEGSVSSATVSLLSEYGFSWCASGEGVLRNSLTASGYPDTDRPSVFSQPCHVGDVTKTAVFFRDDGLSDLIGFTYSDWHADDAVGDFIHHIENIASLHHRHGEPVLVPIILDGENAWEHYPENGYYFLSALYKKLVEHPDIELTTFSEFLDKKPVVTVLEKMVAGSWVYGSFSTWIGDGAKNAAWDLLCDAKLAVDNYMKDSTPDSEQRYRVERQLAICEGSDWCWWFGDYNPGDSVSDFDVLYRLHLKRLYQLIDVVPPAELEAVISSGGGDAEGGGAMRRGGAGNS